MHRGWKATSGYYPEWFYTHPDSPEQVLTHQQMYISPKMVKDQIKKAKRNSAPGPDDIPMLVYAVTSDIIAPILSMLFQLINQSGEIPTLFRETKVKLLYKKKNKSEMANYRPLSLTNQLGKIWERCVNHWIINHLENNNLLSDKQDGFRPKRGTFSNLTKLWEKATSLV
jgi:hypothetical protein